MGQAKRNKEQFLKDAYGNSYKEKRLARFIRLMTLISKYSFHQIKQFAKNRNL